MERNKVIEKLFDLAKVIIKSYSWELYCEMWEICSDWNREHEDEEIFMFDDEENHEFYIEDVRFSFAE